MSARNSDGSVYRINKGAVDMAKPNRANILRAVDNRLRLATCNISLNEIVDELGLVTGTARKSVARRVAKELDRMRFRSIERSGRQVYFNQRPLLVGEEPDGGD